MSTNSRTPLTVSTDLWAAYLAACERVDATPDDSGPLKPTSLARTDALLEKQRAMVRLVASAEVMG